MLMTNRMPLNDIIFFRPIQSDNRPANKVEMTLPSKTAATTNESCPSAQTGRGFKIRAARRQ